MDRRTTLKWMLSASALAPMGGHAVGGELPSTVAAGYGTDPDLTRMYRRGELWPLTFTEAQRRAAAALCDVIIPADALSASASAVGVVDFLDEWVSAPYPQQRADAAEVMPGLAWLDAESRRRFARPFADLGAAQQHAICDDICHEASAAPEFVVPARFFARYRDLTAGGFYSSPEGRRDLGYVGNVPQARFDAPPPDVLQKLGLGSVSP